jgi:hypothetical protein
VRNRNPARGVAGLLTLVASVTCLTFALPVDLAGQQAQTMVRGESDNGGYGAAVFKGSAVNDQFAGFFGLRGGYLLDHVFSLGAGAYLMGGGVDVDLQGGGTGSLDLWYGGAEIEFIGIWNQLYHITFLVLVGGGAMELDGVSDGIWATEPALNLEINVATWLRIDFGGGYRFIWDVDTPGLTNGDASQFFGQLVMKFGTF